MSRTKKLKKLREKKLDREIFCDEREESMQMAKFVAGDKISVRYYERASRQKWMKDKY